MGVIDGMPPLGVETETDVAERRDPLVRHRAALVAAHAVRGREGRQLVARRAARPELVFLRLRLLLPGPSTAENSLFCHRFHTIPP